MLRADADVAAGCSETELAMLEADAEDDRRRRATNSPTRPDLVLIDGGLGQLGVAREVLATSASPTWR